MSGRPVLATRYQVTLTAAHFPVGDEVYDFGVEPDADEVILGSGIAVTTGWDVDPPTISATTLAITGADDGIPAGGTVVAWALIGEPGLEVTVAPPEVPE
jgi:hypothetical protein